MPSYESRLNRTKQLSRVCRVKADAAFSEPLEISDAELQIKIDELIEDIKQQPADAGFDGLSSDEAIAYFFKTCL